MINTIERVVGYRELWVKQKLTLSQLYALRNEIDYYKAGLVENDEVDEHQVNEFFKKYPAIWETASNEWLRLRREQEQEGKTPR